MIYFTKNINLLFLIFNHSRSPRVNISAILTSLSILAFVRKWSGRHRIWRTCFSIFQNIAEIQTIWTGCHAVTNIISMLCNSSKIYTWRLDAISFHSRFCISEGQWKDANGKYYSQSIFVRKTMHFSPKRQSIWKWDYIWGYYF